MLPLAKGLLTLDALVDAGLVESVEVCVGGGEEVLSHELCLNLLVNMQLQLVGLPNLLHYIQDQWSFLR